MKTSFFLFQVDGRRLPDKRIRFVGGEMTMSDLRKSDHGVYECVVSNEVATIVARTALLIERTTPHAPTNVTVSSSETFAVTVEWMPGYSGCSSCQQSYRIRYKKNRQKIRQKNTSKKLVIKFVKKIPKEPTPSNSKVAKVNGFHFVLPISVLRSSARPARRRRA